MYNSRENHTATDATKKDLLESILNRAVPTGHTVESSTTVITNNGTVVINVYGCADPIKPPADPDIITIRKGNP